MGNEIIVVRDICPHHGISYPPMTARTTHHFAPTFCNYDKDSAIEDAYNFNLKILKEDRLIIENQNLNIYYWI